MTDIREPRFPADHPDYQLECEFQMEPAFLDIVSAAEAAGWDATTVARAMKSLATNYMRSREANVETDLAIEAALRARGL